MKKSVIALILLAVLIIIVSPGFIGKMAEDSVSENLNWAAEESGELIVSSDGFDRGWFSSEGQHRVEIGDGSIRAALSATGDDMSEAPVLLINTHIDHGLIPLSSLRREEGSLSPGLGSAVSTLALEMADGELIDLPGAIYSELGLGGDLNSRYVLDAGSHTASEGEVTWQPSSIRIAASATKSDVSFEGNIGKMTFANNPEFVSIDGLTFLGSQVNTPYGFHVGDLDLNMGALTTNSGDLAGGGMRGMSLKASSSVDDGLVTSAFHLEMNGPTIPDFGEIGVIADMDFDGIDAVALGAVSRRFDELSGSQDLSTLLVTAEEELKDLLAAGINIGIDQFDVALPMGTVEARMSFDLPKSDRAAYEWTSLLLDLVAEIYISVPEALVQLATSMDPQAGALVGMGYLKKKGDAYVMDAQMKKGLLTVNGAPIPIPMGAFR